MTTVRARSVTSVLYSETREFRAAVPYKLRNVELQFVLRSLGMSHTGVKKMLRRRIQSYYDISPANKERVRALVIEARSQHSGTLIQNISTPTASAPAQDVYTRLKKSMTGNEGAGEAPFDSFYKVASVIVEPQLRLVRTNACRIQFALPDRIWAQVALRGSKFKLHMRYALVGGKAEHTISSIVNGVPVNACKKEGSVSIGECISASNYRSSIVYVKVNRCSTSMPLVYAIVAVEDVGSMDMARTLQNQNVLTKERAIKRIVNIVRSSAEFGLDTLNVSLQCPLTMCRIRFPARLKSCTHVPCFDLYSLIEMSRSNPKMSGGKLKCPVCNRNGTLAGVVGDVYFREILSALANQKDAESVVFDASGAWTLPCSPDAVAFIDDQPATQTSNHVNVATDDVMQDAASAVTASPAKSAPPSSPARGIEPVVIDLTLSDDEEEEEFVSVVNNNAVSASVARNSDNTLTSPGVDVSGMVGITGQLSPPSPPPPPPPPPSLPQSQVSASANTDSKSTEKPKFTFTKSEDDVAMRPSSMTTLSREESEMLEDLFQVNCGPTPPPLTVPSTSAPRIATEDDVSVPATAQQFSAARSTEFIGGIVSSALAAAAEAEAQVLAREANSDVRANPPPAQVQSVSTPRIAAEEAAAVPAATQQFGVATLTPCIGGTTVPSAHAAAAEVEAQALVREANSNGIPNARTPSIPLASSPVEDETAMTQPSVARLTPAHVTAAREHAVEAEARVIAQGGQSIAVPPRLDNPVPRPRELHDAITAAVSSGSTSDQVRNLVVQVVDMRIIGPGRVMVTVSDTVFMVVANLAGRLFNRAIKELKKYSVIRLTAIRIETNSDRSSIMFRIIDFTHLYPLHEQLGEAVNVDVRAILLRSKHVSIGAALDEEDNMPLSQLVHRHRMRII